MKHNEQLGVPPFDRILVQVPYVADRTEGGLHIPEEVKKKKEKALNRGRLLDAGLKGLDYIRDGGWRIGDELSWGMYAPVYLEWEDNEREEREDFVVGIDRQGHARTVEVLVKHRALVLNVADVMTNIDLAKRLNSGEQVIEYIDGQHRIRDVSVTDAPTKRKNGDANAHAA